MTVNTDWFPFADQRWRTNSTRVFVGKITVTTYTCRYGPVSLDLSVVVSQTTDPETVLIGVARGPVPDP